MSRSRLAGDNVPASGSVSRIEAVSIAAPAYNEAEGIENVVRQWIDYLRCTPAITRFEVVVCNDGSRDDTGAIIDRVAAEVPELRPVHLGR